MLLCAWLLLSLVTVATYTGKLTSNSVVTKQRLPFKSLSELVKRTDYRWGVEKGTMMDDIFSVSWYNLNCYILYIINNYILTVANFWKLMAVI